MEKKQTGKLKFKDVLNQIDDTIREKWELEQQNLCKKIIHINKVPKELKYICGMDLTFSTNFPNIAIASVVVIDQNFNTIKSHSQIFNVDVPYVPSFLAFREIDPMLQTYENFKQQIIQEIPDFDIDLIFVDGNGILHPRECGLAVHLGVILNKPTIGCAKTMFAIDGLNAKETIKNIKEKFKQKGDELCHEILIGDSGKIWGAAIKNTAQAFVPLIISIGNKVDIETAVKLVYQFSKSRVVEPVRLADKESRRLMTKFENFVKKQKISEIEAMKTFKLNQQIQQQQCQIIHLLIRISLC